VNATSVYTAGDTHINDMQLEALGSDALKMMDVAPNSTNPETPLQRIIRDLTLSDREEFKTLFLKYTNTSGAGPLHDIQFNASYSCRDANDIIQNVPITDSRELTGGEHVVRATKWVIVDKGCYTAAAARPRAVLVEVLLWRD
jgi:hypothetical protein